MRGKITFHGDGHPTSKGMFVPPVSTNLSFWRGLNKCLGRRLKKVEMREVIDGLEFYQALKIEEAEQPSVFDVRKTLLALSKMKNADDAKTHFKNADATTQSWIMAAIYRLGFRDTGELTGANGKIIVMAAPIALRMLASSRCNRGQPQKIYQRKVVAFSLNTWNRFGGRQFTVWSQGRTVFYKARSSQLHTWATLFLRIIGDKASDRQVRLLLQEEIASKNLPASERQSRAVRNLHQRAVH